MSNCGTRRKKAGGKIKGYNMGGSLKAVPQGNPGLGKLPEGVRNKMGYKAAGGKIKGMKEGGMCRGYGKARGNRPVSYG